MAAIPDRFLPHTVTVVTPLVETDEYGDERYNYVAGTVRTMKCYMQPQAGTETTDAQQTAMSDWRVFSVDAALVAEERIVWQGREYDIYETPSVFTGPGGAFHHTEARARRRA